jgi:hypothetical protein
MNTGDLFQFSPIPRPEAFNLYFLASPPSQFGAHPIQDPKTHLIDGIVFPEATSAWYLRQVLHHLSSPTGIDPISLSDKIWQHSMEMSAASWLAGDRNAAVGTDLMYVGQACRIREGSWLTPSLQSPDETQLPRSSGRVRPYIDC